MRVQQKLAARRGLNQDYMRLPRALAAHARPHLHAASMLALHMPRKCNCRCRQLLLPEGGLVGAGCCEGGRSGPLRQPTAGAASRRQGESPDLAPYCSLSHTRTSSLACCAG